MAKLVVIINACFECNKKFVQPQKLRKHLVNQHITFPERTKARRHNNHNFTYVKTSAAHDSIEEHFGCPACLQRYAMIHELKNHYYSDHPDTIPATHQQQLQRQITNKDDSLSHRQEIATASDDSVAEHQEIITSNDGVLATGQPEQSAEQNKRRASYNDSIENELLNPTGIYFPPPDPQNHFMVVSRCERCPFQLPTIDPQQ
ncbi:hypothetical protein RMCBS344292_04572 [Rhizopus microsporus]|nr:hypothetical protein RMCBS344292_04572 [Rhizopus microsporus]